MKIKKLLTITLVVVSVLALSVFALFCGKKNAGSSSTPSTPSNEAVIVFNMNTTEETNVISNRSVVIGRRISEPKAFIKGENPDNLQVYGWYTSKACTENTRWDFKKNKVTGNVTLYAKWVPYHDVNYIINGEEHSTVNVFEGDLLEETAEIVMGYKYLGTFADPEYNNLFDFNSPITEDTDVYVKRSQGLYLSDYEEEGLLSSGGLTKYLTAACGSYNPEMGTEEGWVEPYVTAKGEKCTYVNFGKNPQYGDGYVELSLMLDITQSQTIRLTYKNIGKGTKINCYFTAILEDGSYSETGQSYNSNFNWPNYVGGPVGDAHPIPSEMSEDDEWQVIDFKLHEVYKNGYSVWGTSTFLGSIRIEVNYKNKGEHDWSNEMLIKSIEGIPEEVSVEDSEEALEVYFDAMRTDEDEIIAAGESRPEMANGIDFVKDYQGIYNEEGDYNVEGNAEVYPTVNGIVMYAENEILAREDGNKSKGFIMTLPEGRNISFASLTTLNVTLRNYGYQKELTIYVYNDEGTPIPVTLEIGTQMLESKTYSVNLYGLFGVKDDRSFSKIEFVYTSKGVDNLILFESVYFTDFKPFDSVGINFNDKFTYGFESNSDVDVTYNSKDKGIDFNVKTSGVVLTSPEKTYNATNEGYAYMSLVGKRPTGSNVTKVEVQLKVNGEFGTTYTYDIAEDGMINVKVPLNRDEAGYVKAVKLVFTGTGIITIRELAYSVSETSLPFYLSYDGIYNYGHTDWRGGGGAPNVYEYDNKEYFSNFMKNPLNPYMTPSIYIGYSANETYLNPPHTTKNVYIPKDATRIVVTFVYQNRTEVNDMGIHVSFDDTPNLPGDGSRHVVCTNHGVVINSGMGDYEWSAVSVVIEGDRLKQYLNSYLAKINFEFAGDHLSLRAMSIDVEVE